MSLLRRDPAYGMSNIQDVFSTIYAQNLWGGGSGTGSRPENNTEYIRLISQFMVLNEVRSVVDLGCGDWQFSKLIDWSKVCYTGIDVTPAVVGRNIELFSAPNIAFLCSSDIEDVPEADLLICKDVFQHLPNAMVLAYLAALRAKFKWLIITNDDYPEANRNGDIPAGHWRALRLDQPPFLQDCVSLLSWVVVSETPTVRKRTVLIRGDGQGLSREAAAKPDARPGAAPIPRRIFQTWKVRAPLPERFERWSNSVREKNPDYEYVLWDDADNRAFIAAHYAWFLDKYDSFEREIYRVDAVRYFAMYHFGGFYMDLDVECLAPLDRYLTDHEVLFGRMGSEADHPHSIPNAVMASRPRQSFWLYVMSHLLTGPSAGGVEWVTGPVFLKRCIDGWNAPAGDRRARVEAIRAQLSPDLARAEHTRRISLLSAKEWYPLDWSDPIHQMLRLQLLNGPLLPDGDKALIFNRATLVNYWSHTW
jgi:inositol phosphorylceramide mannosyltransferase catalytic subunit